MSDVNITAGGDVTDLLSAMAKAGKAGGKMASDLERAGQQGAKSTESSSQSIVGSLKKIAAGAGLLVAGKAVLGFTKQLVDAAAESQVVGAQTDAVLKSTANAAGLTAKGVGDLATAISKKNAVDDEGAQSGLNMLLTFKNIRNEAGKGNDVFNQTGQTLADMSRAMGTDMSTSAIQLGKALNDPVKGVGALSKVGVTFDDQQKSMIKSMVASGDVMGAQKVILKELNGEFGGSGAKYAETYAGKMDALKIAGGNLQETLGGLLLPVLSKLAGVATKGLDWLTKDQGGFSIFTNAAKDAFGQLLPVIQPLVAGFQTALGPAVGGLGKDFLALLPALSPVMTILKALAPQFPLLAGMIGTLAGVLVGGLMQVLPTIAGLFTTLGGVLGTVFAAVVPIVVQLVTQLAGIFTELMPSITTIVQLISGALAGAMTTLAPIIAQVAGVMGHLVTDALGVLAPILPVVAGLIIDLVAALLPVVGAVLKLVAPLAGALLPLLSQLAGAVLPLVGTVITALLPIITPLVKILGTTLVKVISALLPIVSAVFGALVPIISGAITVVTGVIDVFTGLLTGNWSKVWGGLGKIVSGAFQVVVGVLTGAVGIVVAAVKGIVTGGIAAFQGFVSGVASIGGNVVQGIVDGITGAGDSVLKAIGGVVSGAIDWAKSLLGIHSPSKVFKAIGEFVNAGFRDGLNGSAGEVQKAMTSLVSKVTGAFDSLIANRTAAQKKLDKLEDQYKDASAKRKKVLAGQIDDEKKVIAAINKDLPSKKQRGGLIDKLQSDTKALGTLARERDRVADRLAKAQDKLAGLKDDKKQMQADVASNAIAGGDVVNSYGKAVQDRLDAIAKADDDAKDARDQVTDLTSDLADAAKTLAQQQADRQTINDKLNLALQQSTTGSASDRNKAVADIIQYTADLKKADGAVADAAKAADGVQGKLDAANKAVSDASTAGAKAQASNPVSSIVDTLKKQVADTQEFQTLLAQLKTKGLDQTSYSQLVAGGVENGLATAKALASDGSGAVQQIAALQGQLDTAANQLGTSTSKQMYDAGIAAAQANVTALTSQATSIDAAIGVLEQAALNRVKGLGINTSGAMKDAGRDIVKGLAQGVKANAKNLDDVFDDLSKGAVNRLKKALGIKSPSRVMDREVGQMMGAGVVQGVKRTYSDVNAAVSGLVSVPRVSGSSVGPASAVSGARGAGGAGSGDTHHHEWHLEVPAGADRDDVEYAENLLGKVRFAVESLTGGQ